jgi:hypothetical protein
MPRDGVAGSRAGRCPEVDRLAEVANDLHPNDDWRSMAMASRRLIRSPRERRHIEKWETTLRSPGRRERAYLSATGA